MLPTHKGMDAALGRYQGCAGMGGEVEGIHHQRCYAATLQINGVECSNDTSSAIGQKGGEVQGAMNGRKAGRLRHWVRDYPGRVTVVRAGEAFCGCGRISANWDGGPEFPGTCGCIQACWIQAGDRYGRRGFPRQGPRGRPFRRCI